MGEWRAGRRVRIPAQLRRPSRYLNPGVPDHERALARRGTTLVGTVKSGALVEVLARGSWFDEAVGECARLRAPRDRAARSAAGARDRPPSSPPSSSATAPGSTTTCERRLQEAGTYHVIAISGGNIAILAGLLLGAFRLAGRARPRRRCSRRSPALLAYARLVGGGASVDRATLMAVVYFAARRDRSAQPAAQRAGARRRAASSPPIRCRSPIPAFLLTFGATLASSRSCRLIATQWRESRAAAASPRLAMVVAMLAASVGGRGAAVPGRRAASFSRVTFAGLALNFAAIPLMAVAQIAGMAVVPAALVSAPAARRPRVARARRRRGPRRGRPISSASRRR